MVGAATWKETTCPRMPRRRLTWRADARHGRHANGLVARTPELAFGGSPKLKNESIANLIRIYGKKRWLPLHPNGQIAALMVAYWLQLHPKEQHFHGDEIPESLVVGVASNSLPDEHLEN